MNTALILALLITDPASVMPKLSRETKENNRFMERAAKNEGVMSITRHETEHGVLTYHQIELGVWLFDKHGKLNKQGQFVADECFRAAKLNGIRTPLRFMIHNPEVPIPDPSSMIQRLRNIAEAQKKKR